ncbi:heme o synthase [Hyphomonas sp. UBA4508]|uniref:heme o synthase n=1 Tax=Hyphomonas sp. UBA4508 TaxID=1946633 RepID=UPI0025C44286|nr:heme o synthase [Hyphomonas sp. UBA4508]
MTEPSATSDMAPKRYATAGDYVQLLKPRIMMLVVFTAIAGLVAAVGVTGVLINPVMAAIATLAIALGSGAAGAINMWYDADIDQIMTRTSTRPIPSGAVPKEEALAMGLIMSGVSVLLMWLASNWLAAALLAFSIFYYGVIYTMWLKRSTPQNIVIGGGAGAFPPVIGWAAVTGNTPVDAWILFAIIFFWTPPHFWALAMFVKSDYAQAGVPMMPVVRGEAATRHQILAYSLFMVPLAAAPWYLGTAGVVYGGASLALTGFFAALAVPVGLRRSVEGDTMKPEKRLFAYSILYLFALFGVLVVDRVLQNAGIIAGAFA